MTLNINPLRFLNVVRPPPPPQTMRMATVVTWSPFVIQFDGEIPYFNDAIVAVVGPLNAGDRIIATRIANAWVITNVVNARPPVRDWTPDWTTSTGLHTPSIGNGSMIFRYLDYGGMCFVTFSIVFGTTTNFNGGTTGDNWFWSLPFPIQTTGRVGYADAIDASSNNFSLIPNIVAGNSAFSFNLSGPGVNTSGASVAGTNGGVVDALTPFAWTASGSNFIRGSFFYEV